MRLSGAYQEVIRRGTPQVLFPTKDQENEKAAQMIDDPAAGEPHDDQDSEVQAQVAVLAQPIVGHR